MAQPPPLFVPDLTKPAGAELDADGHAACITCKARMLPRGWTSSARAIAARRARTRRRSTCSRTVAAMSARTCPATTRSALSNAGVKMVATGAGVSVLGVVLMVATAGGFGKYVLAAGVGSLFVGFNRMSTARSR